MHLLTCYLSWTTCRSGESTSNFCWLQNYTGRTVVLSGLEVISEYAQMDEQFSSAMPERRQILQVQMDIFGMCCFSFPFMLVILAACKYSNSFRSSFLHFQLALAILESGASCLNQSIL